MNMPSRNWSTPFHLRRLPNLRIWIGYQCYVEHLKTKNRPCHLVTSGTVRPKPGVWTVSSSVSPYWPFRHSVFSALNTLWHFVFNKKSIQLFFLVFILHIYEHFTQLQERFCERVHSRKTYKLSTTRRILVLPWFLSMVCKCVVVYAYNPRHYAFFRYVSIFLNSTIVFF